MTNIQRHNPSAEPGRVPALCLGATLALFSYSLLYPAGAYPMRGAIVAIGVTVLMAMLAFGIPRSPLLRMPNASVPVILAWGAVWIALSLLSPHLWFAGREEVVTAITAILGFLVAFGAVATWPDDTNEFPNPTSFFLKWMAVLLGILSLFGVYQVFGVASMPRTFAHMEQTILSTLPEGDLLREGLLNAVREGRATGTVGAPNIHASFCLYGVIVALGVLLGARKGKWRIAGIAAAAVSLFSLYLSGSNGGVLSLVAGVVVYTVLLLAWRTSAARLPKLLATATIIILLLAAGVAVLAYLMPTENSRWLGRSGMQQRFYYWQTATEIWRRETHAIGAPGSFDVYYIRHRVPGSNETSQPHSWFFEYLASTGISGLVLFGVFLFTVFSAVLRLLGNLRSAGRFRAYAESSAIIAATAALLFHGLIEYTFSFQEGVLLFFLSSGVVVGSAWRCTADTPCFVDMGRKPLLMNLARCIYIVLFVTVGVVIYKARIAPGRAASAMDEAYYLIEEHARPLVVLSAYRRAIEADPVDPANWEARGLFRLRTGDTRGVDDLLKAVALNPSSARLCEQLATYHAGRGEWAKAIEYQQRAVANHPLDVGHRLTLAELFEDSGDHGKAVEIYNSTLDLLAPTILERERRDAVGRRLGVTD